MNFNITDFLSDLSKVSKSIIRKFIINDFILKGKQPKKAL